MENNLNASTSLSTEQTYKAIAIELLEEMMRGKDVKTIFSREKIFEILEKVKEKGYHMVHQDLNNANQTAMNNFTENKEIIFKTLLRELPEKLLFDIELFKHGKTFNGLKGRYAIINKDGLFSSPDKKYVKSKCKDKTACLMNAISIRCETKETAKGEWSAPHKKHRLTIEFNNPEKKNKKDNLYLYFGDEKQLGQCKEFLFGMKSLKKNSEVMVANLKSMQKMIEGSFLFYGVFKLLEAKQRVKKRKVLLNSLKNYSNEAFSPLNNFIKSVCSAWVYKTTKKNYLLAQKKASYPKYKFLLSNFPNKEDEIEAKQFKSLSFLKKNVQTIVSKFPEFFGGKKNVQNFQKKDLGNKNKLQLLASLNKFVAFKLKSADLVLSNSGGVRLAPNVDQNRIRETRSFTINKKNLEVNFQNANTLTKQDLLAISNLFLNVDLKNEYESNYLVINGPKIDPHKFLKYSYKKTYVPELSSERFVEPEAQELAFNQSTGKEFKTLYFQIFHSIFVFETRDFNYLEVNNNDNKSGNFKFINPIEDFYFFISIVVNKTYKLRTKLVKATKYENDRFIIEFNVQHLFNSDCLENFNPLEIRVSLNLLPVSCFDVPSIKNEQDKNFYVDYLKPYEMGFCIVNDEKINNRVFEYPLVKEGVNLSDENRLIMNFMIDTNVNNSRGREASKFYGKEFNVGNEIYALEEITKEFFTTRLGDERIDPDTKEKLYSVKFSDEGYILLRPPISDSEMKSTNFKNDEEFTENFLQDTNISPYELGNLIYNKKFNFIPHCEKFTDKTSLEKSSNLYLNKNDITEIYPNIEPGEWIYKLSKIKKFFLGSFKGVTESRNFVYHNYFTNEVKTTKIFNAFYDIKRKFKPVQENLFGIYDFDEIEKSNLENGNNYHWKIGLKFVDRNEMNAFIFFLKDLRRRANLEDKKEKVMIDTPININILTYMTKSVKTSLKSLKILPNQIEFRQNFKLAENKKLQIKLSKANVGDLRQGRYMLESLDELDSYGFQNSILNHEDVKNDIKILKGMKSDTKILPKEWDLKNNTFNESHKIVKFGKVDWQNKALEMEAKPGVDKVFTLEIVLKGQKSNDVLTATLNLDNILNFHPQADVLYVPLFRANTKTICGIMSLNVWAMNPGKFEEFDNLFENYIFSMGKNKVDRFGNFISLGKFEPNVYRRGVLRRIHNSLKKDINTLSQPGELENKEKRMTLYNILEKKCIRFSEDLLNEEFNLKMGNSWPRWKDLIPDLNKRHFKILKKFYLNKKRNEFYQVFSKCEWEIFFKKIFSSIQNKDRSLVFENVDMYSLLPAKSDLISWKTNQSSLFAELKYLYGIGIPPEGRVFVWERILDIKNLVTITKEKLVSKGINFVEEGSLKNDVYKHFENLAISQNQFNINFSLIDNDLNFLSPISESNYNLNSIKYIAKAFFLWSELNITTDSYVRGKLGENRKFVYFFGLLKIIQKLFSVLKSESQTFWIIVGLSQIIDLFYQSDPLFNNGEMSYTKIYVLITRLIMQTNLKNIFNKFVEIGFPIEFFIARMAPTLYSDLLQTELFLRLMDIIIFEAALKTNSNDRYDYLRVICTIPLTLLQLNAKKISECKSVKEMERVFDDLVRKSFNNQRFVEMVRENVDNFYGVTNFLERFIELKEETSWDVRRVRIENKLYGYFYNVQSENTQYLKTFSDSKTSLGGNKFIENIELEVSRRLNSIRKVFSMGTPDDFVPGGSLSEIKNGVAFLITNYTSFDENSNSNINKPDEIYVYTEYNKNILNFKEFNFKLKPHSGYLQLDHSGINSGFNISSGGVCNQSFQSATPRYLNIFFMNGIKNSILGQYVLDISKLDIMKPYKLKLESIDQINKTAIELCLFKYSLEKVKDEDADLYDFVFSHPAYLFDGKLETEINGVLSITPKDAENLNKLLTSVGQNYFDKLEKEFSSKGKFQKEEYMKNCVPGYSRPLIFTNDKNETKSNPLQEKIEEMFKNILEEKKEAYPVLFEWLKTNQSSFEEILYAIILVDLSSITIYDKLKLIFDVGRMKNYLIHNSDMITVEKLKELVYSLYKRYMVYFSRFDVDRMIDYILKQESFINYKSGVIYPKENSKHMDDLINDNDHIATDIVSKLLRKKNLHKKKFVDVKRNLINFIRILRNQFNMQTLPLNILNLVYKYIVGNAQINSEFTNKFRIDIDSDNCKKIKILDINLSPNNLNSPDASVIQDERGVAGLAERFKFGNEISLVEFILGNEANALEFSNSHVNNNTEISFDKFKDIFFSLPFISDLLRASCGFNYTFNENFIKYYENVKVEISYPEGNVKRNFVFSANYDASGTHRSSHAVVNFNMAQKLESSVSIQEILERIYRKLDDYPELQSEYQVYFKNPKLIHFFVLNKQTGIEEKLKFYDPLYSNTYIRDLHTRSQLDIIFKLAASDDVSRIDLKYVMKKPGFAKFKNVNISPYYEWRQCTIKEDNFTCVKFKSFENHYYIKTNEQEVIQNE